MVHSIPRKRDFFYMSKPGVIISLFGYGILIYILFLLPFHLYEPTREFDLPNPLWLTHLILLYIHEAGHLFFSPFGHTLNIMGGSLLQIIAPAVWFIVAKKEQSELSNIALFFTGVSIVDVSIYVKDAGMLLLPLIGGLSKSHHDWANLLNDWGMIEWGYALGEILFLFGMILSVLGIYLGLKENIVQLQKLKENNKNILP